MTRGYTILAVAMCVILVAPVFALIIPTPNPGIATKEPKQWTSIDEADFGGSTDWSPNSGHTNNHLSIDGLNHNLNSGSNYNSLNIPIAEPDPFPKGDGTG